MKKSTPFKSDMSEHSPLKEKEQKTLPSSPKKQTIDNILAFSRAYSVRKGKAIEKMEFILN